jgi:hypothetical protein
MAEQKYPAHDGAMSRRGSKLAGPLGLLLAPVPAVAKRVAVAAWSFGSSDDANANRPTVASVIRGDLARRVGCPARSVTRALQQLRAADLIRDSPACVCRRPGGQCVCLALAWVDASGAPCWSATRPDVMNATTGERSPAQTILADVESVHGYLSEIGDQDDATIARDLDITPARAVAALAYLLATGQVIDSWSVVGACWVWGLVRP